MNKHIWNYVVNKKSVRSSPLLRKSNKQKRFVWAKKYKEWTLNQWKSVLWSDESKSESLCDAKKVNGLYMHGSHCEAWRRCEGALLVTLLGIYSKLKAH